MYCNSRAIIAINTCVYCNFTCQGQGGTQKCTSSGFRGSRSCYSHVFIAISRVILQYPHVFIHFLPSFRYPSGAIGGLYRAITVCLLRSIYEKCDIIVCLLQLGLFLVPSGAPFGIPWGSLVVLLGVFGLLWATFWQMRCTFNVFLLLLGVINASL